MKRAYYVFSDEIRALVRDCVLSLPTGNDGEVRLPRSWRTEKGP